MYICAEAIIYVPTYCKKGHNYMYSKYSDGNCAF